MRSQITWSRTLMTKAAMTVLPKIHRVRAQVAKIKTKSIYQASIAAESTTTWPMMPLATPWTTWALCLIIAIASHHGNDAKILRPIAGFNPICNTTFKIHRSCHIRRTTWMTTTAMCTRAASRMITWLAELLHRDLSSNAANLP